MRLLRPFSTFGRYEMITKTSPSTISQYLIPKHIKQPPYTRTNGIPHLNLTIPLKNKLEIIAVREACLLAKHILVFASTIAVPGISTEEIDKQGSSIPMDNTFDWIVFEEIIRHGAYPSPFKYMGYKKSICTSVNNVVVHGIPDSRVLEDGDIVNIDITVYLNGYL